MLNSGGLRWTPPRQNMQIWPLSHQHNPGIKSSGIRWNPAEHVGECTVLLTFCDLHHLPVDPTPDTLSFYIVFLSSHINPKSVNSYLSGISQQLEPFFPVMYCLHS